MHTKSPILARAGRPSALLAGCALAGCAFLPRPTTAPIPTVSLRVTCPTPPKTLLVMLPGSYSFPEDFVREGFVDALRERHVAADVVLVDAHVGYYRERSIVDRLRDDVVAPALARGYTDVWLVGISIGALGAYLYADQQPRGIAGIAMIGPYLGTPAIEAEVRAAGGLLAWQPPAGEPAADEIDRPLWRWLQAYTEVPRRTPRPALFLGYGRSDRFEANDRLLAAALPAPTVFVAEGGHDWTPWRATWQRMLDTMPLRRDAACTPLR